MRCSRSEIYCDHEQLCVGPVMHTYRTYTVVCLPFMCLCHSQGNSTLSSKLQWVPRYTATRLVLRVPHTEQCEILPAYYPAWCEPSMEQYSEWAVRCHPSPTPTTSTLRHNGHRQQPRLSFRHADVTPAVLCRKSRTYVTFIRTQSYSVVCWQVGKKNKQIDASGSDTQRTMLLTKSSVHIQVTSQYNELKVTYSWQFMQ